MTKGPADQWYLIGDADQLDSPALVFYPDRIAANIDMLISSIDDISRLRPHVKTHKNAEISSQLIRAGICKFKCATIAEAEMLAMCQAPDVLLAYQPVGPKVLRFITLMAAYPDTHFSCLVDNEHSVRELAAAADLAGVEIHVFIDLNVGMDRTGVLPGAEALQVYQLAHAEKGLVVVGLHAYDGHIHDASIDVRREKWEAALKEILQLKADIITCGLPDPVVVAGGTPTYPFYAALKDIECSPGTFILWDKGYQDAFTEQEYLTAAVVVTRVISITGTTRVTVDLGHKAVAAENELSRRVFFLNAPQAEMIGQSEEHLVLELGEQHGFGIGDVLYGLPVHICPTVALYATAMCVVNHQLTAEWQIISRNRKINV